MLVRLAWWLRNGIVPDEMTASHAIPFSNLGLANFVLD